MEKTTVNVWGRRDRDEEMQVVEGERRGGGK